MYTLLYPLSLSYLCRCMMELLNYSRQLMQQLQTLRKDSQFCDCTILVGDASYPAHKVVLAASSLLFKSLLESSDSISIDTTVVTPQEFSSLLDTAYLGRLVPGKHDLARVIAAADSLQMFDVAVCCKNILDELVKRCEPDAEGVNEFCQRGQHNSFDKVTSPGNCVESQNGDLKKLINRYIYFRYTLGWLCSKGLLAHSSRIPGLTLSSGCSPGSVVYLLHSKCAK